MKRFDPPKKRVDAVLDTDAYNEIDDQFAIAYMLANADKINTRAIYAAPFHNGRSKDAKDGMEKSYAEIEKILSLCKRSVPVFKGSESFLEDEESPEASDAVDDLIKRARGYSEDDPLYVVAIGAITNVASALIKAPEIAKNLVVVWLGGQAHHIGSNGEFNCYQDIAAARVVMKSDCTFVQLPCAGVVSEFRISGPELEYWFKGKGSAVADYLADNAIAAAESYAKGKMWTRVIWDVTAVAWLLNEDNRFLSYRVQDTRLPNYGNVYEDSTIDKKQSYVFSVRRDALMNDLAEKVTAM